jgi:diacylglycerol O-acyltransferase
MSAIVADAMAQHHLDALSAVDASFVRREDATRHMHVGVVAILEGPIPDFPSFREHVRSRLALVPRYRQKLVDGPLGAVRWVDDPTFNIDYHVRHTGLPGVGGASELWRTVGRVMAQRLDRTKPLWELWLVDGLEGGRWAIGAKTHLALVDGVSSVDLLTVLFDGDPDAGPVEAADAWLPRPEPTGTELAAAGLRTGVSRALALPLRAASALQPGRAVAAVEELGEAAWSAVSPQARTALNACAGPHRRYAVARTELADLRAIKDALGGTVNDVVLAAVTGGLARWLHARGQRTEGLQPRACVPVSVRGEGRDLAPVVVPLPVAVRDPSERLRRIAAETAGLKESSDALGAEVIAAFADLAPPTLLSQASRLSLSARGYDLLVTNIPGPQQPLYALGRRLERLYPIPVLGGDRALAVAVTSYDGTVSFGLLSDLDALPDVQDVADGIDASLVELQAQANGELGLGRKARPRRRSAKRAPRTT